MMRRHRHPTPMPLRQSTKKGNYRRVSFRWRVHEAGNKIEHHFETMRRGKIEAKAENVSKVATTGEAHRHHPVTTDHTTAIGVVTSHIVISTIMHIAKDLLLTVTTDQHSITCNTTPFNTAMEIDLRHTRCIHTKIGGRETPTSDIGSKDVTIPHRLNNPKISLTATTAAVVTVNHTFIHNDAEDHHRPVMTGNVMIADSTVIVPYNAERAIIYNQGTILTVMNGRETVNMNDNSNILHIRQHPNIRNDNVVVAVGVEAVTALVMKGQPTKTKIPTSRDSQVNHQPNIHNNRFELYRGEMSRQTPILPAQDGDSTTVAGLKPVEQHQRNKTLHSPPPPPPLLQKRQSHPTLSGIEFAKDLSGRANEYGSENRCKRETCGFTFNETGCYEFWTARQMDDQATPPVRTPSPTFLHNEHSWLGSMNLSHEGPTILSTPTLRQPPPLKCFGNGRIFRHNKGPSSYNNSTGPDTVPSFRSTRTSRTISLFFKTTLFAKHRMGSHGTYTTSWTRDGGRHGKPSTSNVENSIMVPPLAEQKIHPLPGNCGTYETQSTHPRQS